MVKEYGNTNNLFMVKQSVLYKIPNITEHSNLYNAVHIYLLIN
jgi:hypothetical protein